MSTAPRASWRAAIVALACAGCASSPSSAPSPPPRASSSSLPATAPPPEPDASSNPAAAPAEKVSPLSVVLRTADPTCDVAPFPDGAVIACRSLLLVALGGSIVQDPAWLEGLPEFINWDATLIFDLPDPSTAPPSPTLPVGFGLGVHAGNRHGPDGDVRWEGKRWGTMRELRDARRKSVREDQGVSTVWGALPDGGLIGVQTSSNDAYWFAPGARTAKKTKAPLSNDWFMGQVAAASGRDLWFCASGANIAHFDGSGWTEVAPPPGRLVSCAATSDGKLWAATNQGLSRRDATGAWTTVMPPSAAPIHRLEAAGERLWVVTDSPTEVWSTKPVGQELSVGTLQLPVPDMPGLTGLDVASVDAPSVSAAPAAPGTAACTSLVVWIGRRWTPELRAIVAKHREADALELVEVTGTAPGKIVYVSPGSAQQRVQPSGRPQTAAAGLAASFEVGIKAVTALAPDLKETPPRLLCAAPRAAKKIAR